VTRIFCRSHLLAPWDESVGLTKPPAEFWCSKTLNIRKKVFKTFDNWLYCLYSRNNCPGHWVLLHNKMWSWYELYYYIAACCACLVWPVMMSGAFKPFNFLVSKEYTETVFAGIWKAWTQFSFFAAYIMNWAFWIC
jgi:hypothetical protein